MRQEIDERVYPVMLRALELRDRLSRGEALDFETEQAALRGLLLNEAQPRTSEQAADGRENGDAPRKPDVRYLLACWLDEFFIGFTPWAEQWQEKKLETSLYGTNDRAWRPWEQARQAERAVRRRRPGNLLLDGDARLPRRPGPGPSTVGGVGGRCTSPPGPPPPLEGPAPSANRPPPCRRCAGGRGCGASFCFAACSCCCSPPWRPSSSPGSWGNNGGVMGFFAAAGQLLSDIFWALIPTKLRPQALAARPRPAPIRL